MTTRRTADGLWEACSSMEAVAVRKASSELALLERAFKLAYECGVEAPTLVSSRHDELDMRVASLFLKRTLNDLRATWVLLGMGYTSQSASVAASLWENALVVSCVAGHPDRANKATTSKNGDLPWKPMQLAKLYAADQTGAKTVPEYDLRWREHYGPYKWLCKLKHPTLKSSLHDAFSARKDADTYVVMAVPDLRPENRGIKLAVATIALNRMLSSASGYLSALRGAAGDAASGEWYQRWNEAAAITMDTLRNGERPVIAIDQDSALLKEYHALVKAHRSRSNEPTA